MANEIINQTLLNSIQQDLKNRHTDALVTAMSDGKNRDKLEQVLKREYQVILDTQEKIDYVIQETVGLGIIEDIIIRPDVTDVTFNGTKLVVETNNGKFPIENPQITEEYIAKVIQKFAAAVGKELTTKTPILDAVLGTLRINAIHHSVSPYGTTMALRVVRPSLALRTENFMPFAPMFILDFLGAAIETQANMVISGEVGTGKTELQKLLVSMIPFQQKICMIEDVMESHIKTLFPDKDIHSWITSGSTDITTLIKAALRNNPRWILIAETRGQEAYEMIQSVLSGHHIITTLHAVNARAIPTRLVNMAKLGYDVDETTFIADINKYFEFGLHIKKEIIEGKTHRYLSEVVEFREDGNHQTIFRQWNTKEGTFIETGELSQEFQQKLIECRSDYAGLPKAGAFRYNPDEERARYQAEVAEKAVKVAEEQMVGAEKQVVEAEKEQATA